MGANWTEGYATRPLAEQYPMFLQGVEDVIADCGAYEQEHTAQTPNRMLEFFLGYATRPLADLDQEVTIFKHAHDELVIITGIDFSSLCLHHGLPYWGRATIGYIPNGAQLLGISKPARIVEHFAHRWTIQERTVTQIADYIAQRTEATGVMVVMKAEHSCMSRRGVCQVNARTITSAARGGFRTNKDGCKDEFFRLAGQP